MIAASTSSSLAPASRRCLTSNLSSVARQQQVFFLPRPSLATTSAARHLASSSRQIRPPFSSFRISNFSTSSRLRTSTAASSSGPATPEPGPTSGESEILSLLTKRFQPSHLQVQDVSGGCGSFYAIVIAAKEFRGLNTVKQHRLVNECLKEVIQGIHGLQLKTMASD